MAFPVAGLFVGNPAKPGFLSARLPPAVTVHVDRYDSGFDAALEAYATRHPTPREKQRDATRFGYVESYAWSEDKARQYAVPHRADFGAFVRTQGFSCL